MEKVLNSTNYVNYNSKKFGNLIEFQWSKSLDTIPNLRKDKVVKLCIEYDISLKTHCDVATDAMFVSNHKFGLQMQCNFILVWTGTEHPNRQKL